MNLGCAVSSSFRMFLRLSAIQSLLIGQKFASISISFGLESLEALAIGAGASAHKFMAGTGSPWLSFVDNNLWL